jgi:hypothetical protein
MVDRFRDAQFGLRMNLILSLGAREFRMGPMASSVNRATMICPTTTMVEAQTSSDLSARQREHEATRAIQGKYSYEL